jgi:excinuclease ABC subunit C
VEVQVLHVREGRLVGAQGYGFSDVRLDDGEVMSSFLGQYYAPEKGRQVPVEVLTPTEVGDGGALEALFAEQSGRKVAMRVPRRGALTQLLEMASANAELGLARRLDVRESLDVALEELRERLGLRASPRRIEGYDVSTLHGTLTVASRVVFEDGQPLKRDYRRYRIRQAPADNDFACLREVLQRRFARAPTEPLPDVLMVDGGKGQLGVVSAALRDAGLEVDAIALAKARDEQSPAPRVRRSGGLKAERVFLPGRKDPVMLAPSSRALLLLQRIRDESHRFAIEFQRSLRSKLGLTSILEELPGIGPTKRRALLRHLGSLRAVRLASEADRRVVADGALPDLTDRQNGSRTRAASRRPRRYPVKAPAALADSSTRSRRDASARLPGALAARAGAGTRPRGDLSLDRRRGPCALHPEPGPGASAAPRGGRGAREGSGEE